MILVHSGLSQSTVPFSFSLVLRLLALGLLGSGIQLNYLWPSESSSHWTVHTFRCPLDLDKLFFQAHFWPHGTLLPSCTLPHPTKRQLARLGIQEEQVYKDRRLKNIQTWLGRVELKCLWDPTSLLPQRDV